MSNRVMPTQNNKVTEDRHPYEILQETCKARHAVMVAVSKTRSIEEILKIYALGQRIFAENRVQELVAKAPLLPRDIAWHLIGHLQTNKVRQLLPWVRMIHSLDRINLWETLHEEAGRIGKVVECLLQIKVAREESKFGWAFEDLVHFLAGGHHQALSCVRLRGVMGMATLTEDRDQIHAEMRELHGYFTQLKASFFPGNTDFDILSMGMSGDYNIALEEGSTMIRIGSLLFNDHSS